MSNIKNRDALLCDLAVGLKNVPECRVGDLGARLYLDGEVCPGGESDLSTMLGWLANDIYWNEEGDYSNADSAVVVLY